MDRGAPAIAATLSPLPDGRDADAKGADGDAADAKPDADAFERRVRQTLEKSPGTIERTASLEVPDPADAGRALLLVRVNGESPTGEPQVRDHYLLADGAKRAEIVFTYAPGPRSRGGRTGLPPAGRPPLALAARGLRGNAKPFPPRPHPHVRRLARVRWLP